ncbi:MAG: hypothetical protein WDN06_15865 [Asticcacaulis sp.]
MFNDNGGKVGAEFHVSTSTANDQKTPAIAALTDGGLRHCLGRPADVGSL